MPDFNTKNIQLVKDSLQRVGITLPILQDAILSTAGKETGLQGVSEYSYRNTDNNRLRTLFGNDLADVTDAELTALKKDNIAFYDKVYGGEGGNDQPGDGYKYRGRGFNQITYKDTYRKYGKLLNLDLVNNPDLLNIPENAANVLALFFSNSLKQGLKDGKFKKFGVSSLSDIKDPDTAVKVSVQINAGLDKKWNKTTEEGYKKALSYIGVFAPFTVTNAIVSSVGNVLKKKRTVGNY